MRKTIIHYSNGRIIIHPTLDKDDSAPAGQHWVTVSGSHILVDAGGKPVSGAKGKLNGKDYHTAAEHAHNQTDKAKTSSDHYKASIAHKAAASHIAPSSVEHKAHHAVASSHVDKGIKHSASKNVKQGAARNAAFTKAVKEMESWFKNNGFDKPNSEKDRDKYIPTDEHNNDLEDQLAGSSSPTANKPSVAPDTKNNFSKEDQDDEKPDDESPTSEKSPPPLTVQPVIKQQEDSDLDKAEKQSESASSLSDYTDLVKSVGVLANRAKQSGNSAEYDRAMLLYNSSKSKLDKLITAQKDITASETDEFHKSSLEALQSYFSKNYGINVVNGSDKANKRNRESAKDLKQLSKYQDPHHHQGIQGINIEDSDQPSDNQRTMLGHLNSTCAQLAKRGYNIKSVAKANNTKMYMGTPEDQDEIEGTSWVDSDSSYFCVSHSVLSGERFAKFQKARATMKMKDGVRQCTTWLAKTAAEYIQIVTTHELALSVGGSEAADRLVDILIDLNLDRIWFGNKVSRYGTVNKYVMNAELAAYVTNLHYETGTLPKELEAHVKWLFSDKTKSK